MADELIQIRARPAGESTTDESAVSSRGRPRLATPRKRLATIVEAARAATTILPSRDPAKNGLEKLVLYALGTPVSILALRALVAPLAASDFAVDHSTVLAVAGVLLAVVGSFVVPWLMTFALTLGYTLGPGRSRARIQQALVCPYCRDQVAQEGTVVCARPGCAALYHRECWDECAVQYGGCAIYGCSSKKSREVSAAGFVLRFMRLTLVAALFPPRIARAFREKSGQEMKSVLQRSLDGARYWHRATNGSSSIQLVVVLLGVVAAMIGLGSYVPTSTTNLSQRELAGAVFGGLYGIGFGVLALPFVVAILSLPVYLTLEAIATLFKNELAALIRGDEGGGSVLGRLRSGAGKKECC